MQRSSLAASLRQPIGADCASWRGPRAWTRDRSTTACDVARAARYAARMTTAALVERDTIDRVLAEALARGGAFAEVFCEDKTTTFASMDQRRVEELGNSHERVQ